MRLGMEGTTTASEALMKAIGLSVEGGDPSAATAGVFAALKSIVNALDRTGENQNPEFYKPILAVLDAMAAVAECGSGGSGGSGGLLGSQIAIEIFDACSPYISDPETAKSAIEATVREGETQRLPPLALMPILLRLHSSRIRVISYV
eukprot:GHVU01136968.1.p1 GENE.GHVU01136968.1~~GHVU01136968.1.p1  ORF type:complete len:148 (-),score=22.98 GHVU01136968.1:287-730(-)